MVFWAVRFQEGKESREAACFAEDIDISNLWGEDNRNDKPDLEVDIYGY